MAEGTSVADAFLTVIVNCQMDGYGVLPVVFGVRAVGRSDNGLRQPAQAPRPRPTVAFSPTS